jgi:homoserine dehydrogenase
MKDFKIAILGCGTVGGGVARILLDLQDELNHRSKHNIKLITIVELFPHKAADRFELPIDLFAGKGKKLNSQEAAKYIDEVIQSDDIDLVVETIGGSNDFVEQLAVRILNAEKHLVTANKALLAERGKQIFKAALKNNMTIGFEAAVCGAIPIIKTIKESFSGDTIRSISGIMNGTSNYILSMMQNEGMDFEEALKLAQENGYAESDPTLDINGYDAGHKLAILLKLAFGVDVTMEELPIEGIENIRKEDIDFGDEIDSKIKLICFAKRTNGKVYATVCPMMVKNSNFLSGVNGATNAVRISNIYGGKHILVGAGAGSSETASSIVADIVFASRYAEFSLGEPKSTKTRLTDARHFEFPYIITFETNDIPGITGKVTTCIGKQNINIDTVSHNRHKTDRATFSIATMPCTLKQIEDAINEISTTHPDILLSSPKIIPILY